MSKSMILVTSLLLSMSATVQANHSELASNLLLQQPMPPLKLSQYEQAAEPIWLSRVSNRAFDPRRKQRIIQESVPTLEKTYNTAYPVCRTKLKIQHRPYRKVRFVDDSSCQSDNSVANAVVASMHTAR